MEYLKYVETKQGGMIRHCCECERLSDPIIRAKLVVLQRIFDTQIVTTGYCPECEDRFMENLDKH